MQMRTLLANRTVRPYVLLVAIGVVLWLLDNGRGAFLTTSTAFSVLQQFATIGPIANIGAVSALTPASMNDFHSLRERKSR